MYIVNDIIKVGFLRLLYNFGVAYRKFCNEWYVIWSKNLSATISKVNLPVIKSQCNEQDHNRNNQGSHFHALHCIYTDGGEIGTQHGISLEELYTHDLLECNPLFCGTPQQTMISYPSSLPI